MPKLSLFVCSTVGGTEHLDEWVSAARKLGSKIVIAQDLSRSERIPPNLNVEVITHDSGKKWRNYGHRKDDYSACGRSIMMGLLNLMDHFSKSNETHFLHMDSDQILDDKSIETIRQLKWDYLQFCLPALPSDKQRLYRKDWTRFLMRFWEGSCFGVSRRLLEASIKDLNLLLVSPEKPDIKVHGVLKKHFRVLPNKKHVVVTSPDLVHYINGVKITLRKMEEPKKLSGR